MPALDKVVLVTGAAGALGRATAAAFEAAGASLILLDVDLTVLKSAYPEPSPRRHLVQADLLDESALAAAVESAEQHFGRIDILCNIAGGFYFGESVHEMRAEVWLQQFHINATTVVNAVKSVVPRMLARGSGCVFNIASAAHQQGHGHMSAYAAGKSAVSRLTESMAEELWGTGVRALCLMPEIIDTPRNRTDMSQADASRWTPPSAIADLMVLLSEDAAALLSGSGLALRGAPLRR